MTAWKPPAPGARKTSARACRACRWRHHHRPSRAPQAPPRWRWPNTLARGESVAALVPALRAALHAVPDAERPGLALPVQVFRLLAADVLALVQAEAPASEPGVLSEADAQWLGQFWFACAAGEVRPA